MHSSNSRISVVIPLFNKARHVRRALDSVLAQTFRDFEVIVVNDGSTDGSEKVVEQYADPRVRLVSQKNAGASAARNRGIAEASAGLIAFLDADDEWLPEFLATVLHLTQRYPECGAYATAHDIVWRGRARMGPILRGIPASPWEGIVPNYFLTDPIWTSAVAIPRRVFDSAGFFAPVAWRAQDTDMWCRIALKYPVAFSTRVCAVNHRDADNRNSERIAVPWLREYQPAKTLAGALNSGNLPPGVRRTDLADFLVLKFIWLAWHSAASKNHAKAREYLREGIRLRPSRPVSALMRACTLTHPLWGAARGAWRLARSVVDSRPAIDS